MIIKQYHNSHRSVWDEAVTHSRNGTFLHQRHYIDHKDRFEDHSLIFYDDKNNLLAILPGHINGINWISHRGLTYAGLLVQPQCNFFDTLTCFKLLIDYLKGLGFKELIYKSTPYIYHRYPADDDLFALHVLNAKLVQRDVNSVLMLQSGGRPRLQNRRQRALKKAQKNDIQVYQSSDWAKYWELLTQLLRSQHNNTPTHSLAEIIYLQRLFPNNILLYIATHQNELVAGVVIYDCGQTIKAQYIAANQLGKELHALDALFHFLINEQYSDRLYFDFGSSHSDAFPYHINSGLINHKESFGARTVCQDTYSRAL